MNYTVDVSTSGYFSLSFRVASNGGGGGVHFNVDGKVATPDIEVPGTGNWDAYATVQGGSVYLSPGKHTLTLAIDKIGPSGYAGNFEWFRLDAGGTSPAGG